MTKIYVQMYSLRKECEEDFKKALKSIAEFGYDGVEFAGYYGMDAEKLREYVDELGLEVISAHVGYDLLRENLDNEIQKLKILGAKYIVCPYTFAEDLNGAKEIARELKTIAIKCEAEGLPLLYHNHDHELKLEQGTCQLEVLFSEVPNMKQQLDVFFVQSVGMDVLEYIKQHKDRIKSVHLKQIDNMESRKNTDVANGIIDMKKVIELTPNAFHIYEHEPADANAFEAVKKSFQALKLLL